MARQPVEPRAGTAAEQARKRRTMMFVWSTIITVLLVVVAFPTVILLVLGMLPTGVAYFIDRTPQKNAALCVGGMNFSGVFSFLLDLWTGSHTPEGAAEILSDVFSLAVIYGSAAFGWVMFMAIPPVVATFITVMAQRRIALLRMTQKRLIEEWGEDVAKAQGVG